MYLRAERESTVIEFISHIYKYKSLIAIVIVKLDRESDWYIVYDEIYPLYHVTFHPRRITRTRITLSICIIDVYYFIGRDEVLYQSVTLIRRNADRASLSADNII